MIRYEKKHGIDILELKIMTINIGISTSKSNGAKEIRQQIKENGAKIVDKKRELYIKKIKDEDPDLICIQEVINKDLTEIEEKITHDIIQGITESLDGSCYFKERMGKEVALLAKRSAFSGFTKREIEFEDIDISVAAIRSRLILVELEREGFGRKFIAGSWHGKQRKSGDDQTTVDKNRRLQFMNHFKALMKIKSAPFPYIVGGDFNLAAGDFPSSYKAEVASPRDKSIDYFLYGGVGINVENVKESPYNERDAFAFLDHTPITADVEVLSFEV